MSQSYGQLLLLLSYIEYVCFAFFIILMCYKNEYQNTLNNLLAFNWIIEPK
jgi:hypothetical protein